MNFAGGILFLGILRCASGQVFSSSCDFDCEPGSLFPNCISAEDVCDGEADCTNLSDEMDCPDLGCPGLMDPNNGEIAATSFVFGSEVTYSCYHGYVLEGEVVRTCLRNGKWSGDTPYCRVVECPQLTFEGPWEDGGHFYGQVSTFHCHRGYILEGSSRRTCQTDSTWSGDPPRCRKKGGVEISVTKGNGTLIPGGDMDPDTLIVNRNVGSITLKCRFTAPVQSAYWTINHYTLDSIIGEHTVDEVVEGLEWTLTMEIGDRSQGTYACRSANNAAEIIVDIRVDVFVDMTRGRGDLSPHPSGSKQLLKMFPGETLTLTCTLGYYSTNYIVQWRREPSTLLYSSNTGKEMLPRQDVNYGRLGFTPLPHDLWAREWSLSLRNVSKRDEGNYSCVVPHVAGVSEGKATIQLQIAYDLITAVEVNMTQGVGNYSRSTNKLRVDLTIGTITLTCRVYGPNPVTTPVRWYKSNLLLTLPITERVIGREFDLVLEIDSASYGEYVCVSDYDGTMLDGSIRLEVAVGVQVRLTEGRGNVTRLAGEKRDTVIVHNGEDITITCSIDDLPLSSPLIIWKRGEKTLFSSLAGMNVQDELAYGRLTFGEDRQSKRWTLMLNDVTTADQGVYACILGPSYGQATMNFLVTSPPRSGVEIRLIEDTTSIMRMADRDTGILKVDIHVGIVTLVCRSSRWSESVSWVYSPDLNRNLEHKEVIPGWEWSLTFEFSDKNDKEYVCQTSDGDTGYIILEAIVGVDIKLSGGRGQQSPGVGSNSGDIITVPEGETVTLTCSVTYLPFSHNVIWRREPYSRLYASFSGSRLLISSDPLHGKLSVVGDETTRQWNLTIDDISRDNQNTYSCELFGYGKAYVDVIVVDSDEFISPTPEPIITDPDDDDEGIEITLTEGRAALSFGKYNDNKIKQLQVNAGSEVTLTCRLFIEPALFLFVMWYKANQVVSINGQLSKENARLVIEEDTASMEWSLTIKDLQEKDEGIWSCTSTTDNMRTNIRMIVRGSSSSQPNDDSSQRDPIELSLYKGRGVLISGNEMDQLTTYTGETLTIACRIAVQTSDYLFVTWQKSNKIVSINDALADNNDRLLPEEDRDGRVWKLTVRDVSDDDDGLWTCSSTSNSLLASINLVVIDYIEITLEGGRGNINPRAGVPIVTVYNGDSITLVCRLFARISDYTIVTWQKNKVISYNSDLIDGNGRLGIEQAVDEKEWKLTIRNITTDDQGIWTCNTNIDTLSTSVDLVVIDRKPDVAGLSRRPSNPSLGPSFSAEGSQDTTSISLTEGRGQENLLLDPDIGVFTDIRVTSGDNISMTCNMTLDDTVMTGEVIVVWKKENETVSVGEARTSFIYNERVSISRNADNTEWTLTLMNVSTFDNGQWMCINQNGDSAYAYLTVDETPFGVRIFKDNLTRSTIDGTILIIIDQPVTLTCVANPDIPMDDIYYVLWYKGNTLVSYNDRITHDNGRITVEQDIGRHEWRLTIRDTSEDDFGVWRCVMETGYGRESSIAVVNLTAKVMECEAISEDNMNLCHDVLPYGVTTVPTLLGHVDQEEIFNALTRVLDDFACPLRELACSMFIPACKVIGSAKLPILPCRSVCENAKSKCRTSIALWPPILDFDCSRLPENIDSYIRCWEPTNAIFGDSLPCEKVPSSICQNLGFRHTRYPNAHKHPNAEAVKRAMEDEDLQSLLNSGCSPELHSFVCSALYPQCDDGVTADPCHEVCRRVWKSCKSTASELGIAKPEVFSCGKRYPSSGESGTCLMNINPPVKKPIITGVERMRTSARFDIRSDEKDVTSYVVSAYTQGEPESIRHPISTSTIQTIPAKVLFAAGGAIQPNVVIGDPSVSGAHPLLPNASYFVVIQAKNRYGLGPLAVVSLDRYYDYNCPPRDFLCGTKEIHCIRDTLRCDTVPDCPDGSDEVGCDVGNLTYVRVSNGLDQLICISLVNQESVDTNTPYWTDANGMRIGQRGQGYLAASSNAISNDMSVLNVLQDTDGVFTCRMGTSQLTINLGDTAPCLVSETTFCNDISNYTSLPNIYGHTTLQEAELSSYRFHPLLQSNCSRSPALRQFVCALYFPSSSCSTSGERRSLASGERQSGGAPPKTPCREVCSAAIKSCGWDIGNIGFQWPAEADCEKFPLAAEGNCDHLGTVTVDVGDVEPRVPISVYVNNETDTVTIRSGNSSDTITINRGSLVNLTCEVRQKDFGIQLWTFNSIGISYNGNLMLDNGRRDLISEEDEMTYFSHLVLNDVQPDDEGEYVCQFLEYSVGIRLIIIDDTTSNSTNITMATQNGCNVKQRRYDVVDRGQSCFYRGWTDVQGQGVPNDFCRVVSKNGRNFLSCALAGTTGQSEHNYNSPNASVDWFDAGHTDTWYMMDEDGDGKEDYCRCVGSAPNTEFSCMKAGTSGFIGHYDFTPSKTIKPCHFLKVDHLFGPH